MDFPELCCYINKLKIKQISFEKNEHDLIRIIDTNYNAAVQEEYDKLKNLREHDFNNLRKNMQDNAQSLKQIKSAVVEKNLENIDLQKLKNDMISFTNHSTFLKDQINAELENLLKDELSLTIDVTDIEMKLVDNMNKLEYDSNKVSRYSAKYTNDHQLYEEVKEFLSFLNESGGHDGGWVHEDHLAFLKMSKKIRNKKKLAQSLQRLFPDMAKDKILDHIDWYNKYLELKIKQKTAIDNWRDNKCKKENNQEEKKDLQEKKPKLDNNRENNKVMKAKVEKWKAEKQQNLEKGLEIQIQYSKISKQNEKQKQIKNQEVKKEVSKWKSAKEAKQRAGLLAKEIICLREKERNMMLANKLIREFQNQDNIYITKRLNKLKINVEPPKNQEQSKGCKIVARNPERLLKATQQWLARTSYDPAGAGDNIFNKHLPLKKIPKLAIPVWRQALPQN